MTFDFTGNFTKSTSLTNKDDNDLEAYANGMLTAEEAMRYIQNRNIKNNLRFLSIKSFEHWCEHHGYQRRSVWKK
jgi:hypothetical protein